MNINQCSLIVLKVKKMRFLLSFILFFSILCNVGQAQILTSTPTFPTQNDTIVLIYDATLGNGALEGTLPVFAHTGVITSNSIDDSDWQHVVGDWGTNDPDVLMTPLGNNKHELTIPIQEFYDIDDGEEVYKLAFVFRNVSGSIVGREADGSDIYFLLYEEGNAANIVNPASSSLLANDEIFSIVAQSSDSSLLSLYLNGEVLVEDSNDIQLSYDVDASDYSSGEHLITLKAEFDDETIWDSVYFSIVGNFEILPVPAELKEGINVSVDTEGEVSFNLFAPGKGLIYLIGDFNNWTFTDEYILNQDPSGDFHWITIDGLNTDEEYAFQYYLVDDNLRIGDPYCEKVLDPWNDPYINEDTYPDLKLYPNGLTSGIVSTFLINEEEYTWTDQEYTRPDQENLIVYELLIRDFIDAHSYPILIDTLDYLDSLGITAIEFMPVNEFEGNNSWGYNPSFFLAPDKYYGPKNTYKAFIDECHSRGIAVIMDIALNHSFGNNPQVQMYFDPGAGQWGQPTADSPWLNPIAKHDYNVGYDYNHESVYTKKFVDSVLIHWVTEYHIDGYRMDLSKGFTQNNTLGDVNAWGQYDPSRIEILSDYADHIWDFDPEVYMILEHFAENSEEDTLSSLGFMIWGNLNHEYTEAAMGYSSNLNWGSYQARGWDDPHLVSYMESHDEERMMYKNVNFGASTGDYDITEHITALKRCELVAVFFIPIPGPKMIWQFGELGYDYSINYCEDGTIDEGCRTHPKPIVWNYTQDQQRSKLKSVYKELIKLKREYDVFSTNDFVMNTSAYQKSIQLNSENMNVAILGNFHTTDVIMEFGFVHGGYWYEYFTGDSIMAGDFAPDMIPLDAGEYRLYTDVKLGDGVVLSVEEMRIQKDGLLVYPNPGREKFIIEFPEVGKEGGELFIYSVSGVLINHIQISPGLEKQEWIPSNDLPKGMYFLKLRTSNSEFSTRLIIE